MNKSKKELLDSALEYAFDNFANDSIDVLLMNLTNPKYLNYPIGEFFIDMVEKEVNIYKKIQRKECKPMKEHIDDYNFFQNEIDKGEKIVKKLLKAIE